MAVNQRRCVLPLLILLPVLLAPIGPVLYPRLMLLVNPNETLTYATGRNDARLLQQAVRWGAKVDAPRSYAGRTPLLVAALHGQTALVRVLLAAGADPHYRDEKGLTALDLASKGQHPEVVQLLKPAGAKP